MNDPLEGLLIDEGGVARAELAAALKPYISLGRDGGLWPSGDFDRLTSRQKVLCLLLAVKAQNLLGLRDSDRVSPGELVEMSNMAPGTVRPKVSRLAKTERLIAKDGHDYFVPDAAARRVVEEISEVAKR